MTECQWCGETAESMGTRVDGGFEFSDGSSFIKLNEDYHCHTYTSVGDIVCRECASTEEEEVD